MAKARRVYRVAERIREIIAGHLLKAKNMDFSLLTVTSVVVSRDLQHAKVYWMVHNPEENREKATQDLERYKSALRRQIGRELGIKFVPQLNFFYDETLDLEQKINKLFEKIPAK